MTESVTISSVREQVAGLADALDATGWPEADQARALAERLAQGEFRLGVIGEFKRGKSTLINALLERDLLPTGVLPVTAVPIEIAAGDEGVVIEHLDGAEVRVDVAQLEDYVTEAANPNNTNGVRRARVRLAADLLAEGAVLVDTPGLGSLHAHNTAAAEEAIEDTDGAILVLTADAPLAESERALLHRLAEHAVRAFVVVNRIDALPGDAVEEVAAFVDAEVTEALGDGGTSFALSAARARQAQRDGGADVGFEAFRSALRDFVTTDLAGARREAAARDARALRDRIDDGLRLEREARRLGVEELEGRMARFERAVEEEQRALLDDAAVLESATTRILDEVVTRLREGVEAELPAVEVALAEAADGVAPGELEELMQRTVDEEVRRRFDALHATAVEDVAAGWAAESARFREQAAHRAARIREAAEGIFELRLHPPPTPTGHEAEADFTYRLFRPPPMGAGIASALRRLLPAERQRERAVEDAAEVAAAELHKHVGRARWDLSQRLEQLRLRYAERMSEHVSEVSSGVRLAVERAKGQRARASADLDAYERDAARVAERLDALTEALGGDVPW